MADAATRTSTSSSSAVTISSPSAASSTRAAPTTSARGGQEHTRTSPQGLVEGPHVDTFESLGQAGVARASTP
ncbi:MAG: hypothetical protein AB1673_17120 [Actinomycetota bacterium]